jgi:colanic acid/amylovoran biosynthesis glycosyltransferase
LRILIYSDCFGGHTTTFIYNEVLGISTRYEVLYVCLSRENPESKPFDKVKTVGFKINPLAKKFFWWLEKNNIALIFKNKVFSKEINQVVESFNPDIIHCHFAYEALRFIDNLNDKHKKIPTLISFRGYDASQQLERKPYVQKMKRLLNKPNVYTTFVCDFLRRNVVSKGIDINRFMILYSGTKLDFFVPKAKDIHYQNEFRFLQISSLEPYKGHKYTLAAFAKALHAIAHVNPKLIIAGSGTCLQELTELAIELGIEKNVEFIGWINHTQAIQLLGNADCFVQHSVKANEMTEGIPNSLMEAMAMELPVITTYHAGIPELVENEVHGFLVKEKDVEAMANKMIEITTWPNRLSKNRERIKEKFEYEVHMKKLFSYYKDIHTNRTQISASQCVA